MPTIKDIARIAGVSHGTVSNVLNGRGNVSVEKIEAVQRAAQEVGYQLNAQAQSLRASKSQGVALILPGINAERYYQLYRGLHQVLQPSLSEQIDLYLTNDLPNLELDILQTLAAKSYQAIVTVSCLDNSQPYYDMLRLSPENVFFAYRQPASAVCYFSLDYVTAGEEAAKRALQQQPGHIGVFCEPLEFSHSARFTQAIQMVCRELSLHTKLTIIPAHASEVNTVAFEFFQGGIPDLFIVQDSEKTRALTQAAWFGSSRPCPPIVQLSDNLPASFDGITSYQMDYARLGTTIATCIRQPKSKKKHHILTNCGFSWNGQYAPSHETEATLNMLILPSPSTDALKKLLPHFYRQTGIKVNLAVYPYDEVFEILSHLHLHPYYDLLRIDMACFPWFAEKALLPLESVSPELPLLLDNFSEQIQQHFSLVNGTAWAIPFDASMQLLFYRRDLFEDATIKRMFYESTGKELTLPENFAQFDEIATFFSQRHQPKNRQRPMGTAVTLGSSGLIATEYLLRYYALGGRLVREGEPIQLDSSLAAAALEEYLRQLPIAVNLAGEWWSDAVKQFECGNIAMLIMYLNLFNDVAHTTIAPTIGYAPVPGQLPQLGGGSIGMSRYSKKKKQVEQFFHWLYSDEISRHLVLLGGNIAWSGICHDQNILNLYPWFNLLNEKDIKGIRESRGSQGEPFNLRQAEIIIGQGVTNAINGIMNVNQAVEYINARIRNETGA
ncbi:extracellular solute-binding protein [Escherichia coli]|uniref:extracellular solute-binding protein n=1 Tax=Escherichia coli TaxID=562 RepID=UPI00092D7A5C|nr:extracellular solute-binding protein [Escherichia coli]APJ91930.1 LacI family transcriptional regulator [Escherichia coli]APJ94141.1 LacI family transcriptional regulator [Escherichia coli]EFB1497912.1 extracellular solute-binding protein [Escherichia coli]EFE1629252.1 extracellular solute-binding protein [Escherichia coli]EFH7398721.1 extracellular solute-binding protein [Escherichia coli]